jgi:glutathione synthase/RimK-type ligase-like ATP-grasp enzyme
MIIILTNKDDVTVDFVVHELQKQHIKYYRLNTEDIPELIAINFSVDKEKYLLFDKRKNLYIDFNEIDAVYFRRAEISRLDYISDINEQEKSYLRGELAYALEGIYKLLRKKYWLNNVYDIREAENKIYQLQVAKEVGFITPGSIISNSVDAIESFINKYKEDCIIKPIKTGNVKDERNPKVIFTSKIDGGFISDKKKIFSFPSYLQENIHKQYDLRCIVVGEKVFCAKIHSQEDLDSIIDWRKSKKYLQHEIHDLPFEISCKCVEMTKKLRLRYSAIDLILDNNNNYTFLECNPNGQWAWLEKRLGFPICENIVKLLREGFSNEYS